jgi:hypothetical protein
MEWTKQCRAQIRVGIWAIALAGLVGCSNARTGSNDSISVMPSSPTVSAVVGGSQTLHVSFYSGDGNSLSRLSVTSDLGALPAGWSARTTHRRGHLEPVGNGDSLISATWLGGAPSAHRRPHHIGRLYPIGFWSPTSSNSAGAGAIYFRA